MLAGNSKVGFALDLRRRADREAQVGLRRRRTDVRGPAKGAMTASAQDHRRAVPAPARGDVNREVHGHRRVRRVAKTLPSPAQHVRDDDRVGHWRINGSPTDALSLAFCAAGLIGPVASVGNDEAP
jgi:hypothetical protein